jgi:hypothetical protein
MEVFNAGILVAVISLIYPPAIILYLFIWITMLVYGIFNGRNLIISVLAVLIPYLYVFLYFFWTDRLNDALLAYVDFFSTLLAFKINKEVLQLVIWAIFALLMLFPAFTRISGTLSSFNINFRKKMAATSWLMVFSLPLIVLHGPADYNILIFLPAGVMIAHYYQLFKKSFVNEITVLLFLLLVLINNYLHWFHA